ncbi:hypothetical protein JL100_030355 (plasmid) [Skermanella mucosa]|uniref:hypothetical protein n=1 Tax=Skermanella mucosa TaxID=1789672 RepID=UPI00192C70AD|nr:hypothetical protein [Skermanella mucosa]UEM24530.1 hypothetical protein JL100_030355 [Skermanella mucosa]
MCELVEAIVTVPRKRVKTLNTHMFNFLSGNASRSTSIWVKVMNMMSWLREFRRKMVLWVLTIWRWLGRAKLLWLAVGIIVLGSTIIAIWPSEFSLKLIGMLFQLIGIVVVVVDVRVLAKEWLRSLPLYGKQDRTAYATAVVGMAKFGSIAVTTDPAAPLETRVAALESLSTKLREQLASVEEKLKARSDEIAQEATHRKNADKEILDRMKYDTEKVLRLGAAGALLLFAGVILTTFPVELADFISRLKAA